jgi:hypothetical protein
LYVESDRVLIIVGFNCGASYPHGIIHYFFGPINLIAPHAGPFSAGVMYVMLKDRTRVSH